MRVESYRILIFIFLTSQYKFYLPFTQIINITHLDFFSCVRSLMIMKYTKFLKDLKLASSLYDIPV
jgi:hypothetical protein